MALIGVLQTLVDGQIITAAQHNSNYGDIKTAFNTSAVLTDVQKTITVGHVFAAGQVWNAAQAFAAGLTGPTTHTGVLTQDGLLSMVGGDIAFESGENRNITNLKRIVQDTVDFAINNHANNANNFLLTDAGDATIRGSLTLQAAATKVVPGVTSLAFRNNADTQSNLLISDAGTITTRGQVVLSTSVQPLKLINNAQIVWRNFANTQDAFGIGTDVTDNLRVGADANIAGVMIGFAAKKLSFYGGATVVQPIVAGAKAGNAALASLMGALAALNLVVDNTT